MNNTNELQQLREHCWKLEDENRRLTEKLVLSQAANSTEELRLTIITLAGCSDDYYRRHFFFGDRLIEYRIPNNRLDKCELSDFATELSTIPNEDVESRPRKGMTIESWESIFKLTAKIIGHEGEIPRIVSFSNTLYRYRKSGVDEYIKGCKNFYIPLDKYAGGFGYKRYVQVPLTSLGKIYQIGKWENRKKRFTNDDTRDNDDWSLYEYFEAVQQSLKDQKIFYRNFDFSTRYVTNATIKRLKRQGITL